jgi:L-lactate dehydrogenase complex protein LldG
MATTVLDEFRGALDDAGVTWITTDPTNFAADLADAMVEPAIGSQLPFDDLSLADEGVILDPTPEDLRTARTGVTAADFAIAEYGSIVVRSWAGVEEAASLFPERHVAVLSADDIVPDMTAAFERLGESFRAGQDDAVIATGPSATADMGELVYGAHGPREVHVLVVEGL